MARGIAHKMSDHSLFIPNNSDELLWLPTDYIISQPTVSTEANYYTKINEVAEKSPQQQLKVTQQWVQS
jgi:hypothetical protein